VVPKHAAPTSAGSCHSQTPGFPPCYRPREQRRDPDASMTTLPHRPCQGGHLVGRTAVHLGAPPHDLDPLLDQIFATGLALVQRLPVVSASYAPGLLSTFFTTVLCPGKSLGTLEEAPALGCVKSRPDALEQRTHRPSLTTSSSFSFEGQLLLLQPWALACVTRC